MLLALGSRCNGPGGPGADRRHPWAARLGPQVPGHLDRSLLADVLPTQLVWHRIGVVVVTDHLPALRPARAASRKGSAMSRPSADSTGASLSIGRGSSKRPRAVAGRIWPPNDRLGHPVRLGKIPRQTAGRRTGRKPVSSLDEPDSSPEPRCRRADRPHALVPRSGDCSTDPGGDDAPLGAAAAAAG